MTASATARPVPSKFRQGLPAATRELLDELVPGNDEELTIVPSPSGSYARIVTPPAPRGKRPEGFKQKTVTYAITGLKSVRLDLPPIAAEKLPKVISEDPGYREQGSHGRPQLIITPGTPAAVRKAAARLVRQLAASVAVPAAPAEDETTE